MQRFRPTSSHIAVTLLIVIALAAVALMVMVPVGSKWFWPNALVFAVAAGLALLIPLKTPPHPPR